jgi:hypothetical protein
MWEACRVPFMPELFSGPALARFYDKKRRNALEAVPYFEGLMAGEPDALVGSFVAEPELHDPVQGRVKGTRAFEAFVTETNAWIARRNITVETVAHVVIERHGFEEVVLHLDGETGRVDLPVAIVADREHDGHIDELRIYFSTRALTRRHANRPPLLHADPELRAPDILSEHQAALAAGDVDAIVATFEPDGYAREPAGGQRLHTGQDGLRSFYRLLFSNDGGIPLEHCALIDDKRTCALEYNVVRWGQTDLSPQAGVAVYVRGQSGKIAAVRIYDDVAPPSGVDAAPGVSA